ncbi:unnamed protein product [Prunus brigantina]
MLAWIRLHHAAPHHPCYRLTHPIYHTTVALRATRRSTAQKSTTYTTNGLVAQAVNLTAETSSFLGHNHSVGFMVQTISGTTQIAQFDLEPERTLRKQRREINWD